VCVWPRVVRLAVALRVLGDAVLCDRQQVSARSQKEGRAREGSAVWTERAAFAACWDVEYSRALFCEMRCLCGVSSLANVCVRVLAMRHRAS
jgi:hypothetical protein